MQIEGCYLCFKNDTELIDIFGEQGIRFQISSILAQHFWFEIEPENSNEKLICTTCWWKVENFHVFYKNVQGNHAKYDDHIETSSKHEYSSAAFEESEITELDQVELDQSTSNNRRREPHKSLAQVEEEDEKIKQYFKLECNMCTTKFNDYKEMRPHYRSKHQILGYLVCCNTKFLQKVCMLEHIAKHLNPDMFKCATCNKSFSSKKSLKSHLDKHKSKSEQKFKCPKCSKTFVQKHKLNQHMIYHKPDEEKQFKCDQCAYAAGTNSILQAHIRKVHQGSDEVMCSICAKKYRSKYFFQKHFELEHTDTPLKVQCELCGIWLKHERSLRSHMVRHSDSNKEFICDICKKHAPNRNALSRHKMYAHLKTKK